MKNSNDTIRNRTRDLLACSAVPQPTAPLRAPGIVVCIMYETNTHLAEIKLQYQEVRDFVRGLEVLCCKYSCFDCCKLVFP